MIRSPRSLFALAVLAAWWCAGPARADHIDEGLLKASRGIMSGLQARGYKNVGVLKFQVQKGKEEPSFQAGRLGTLMATRLENALILAEDVDNPVGVTRGASQAAAERDKAATYRTAEGRRSLFRQTYPLAWGDGAVKVDAFLTGLVQVDPEKKETTVIVRAFDAKDADLREADRFTVKIDRGLLADMNRRFLSKRAALGKQLLPEEEVVEDAIQDSLLKTAAAEETKAALDQLLEFTLFYDNKPVTRGPDNRVPQPTPDQTVHFALKARQRIGLVLRVNGVNTVGNEVAPKEIDRAAQWVLEKDREYAIRGFYSVDADGKSVVKPFRVVPPSAVSRAELADESRLGQIDLDVFREGTAEPAPEKKVQLVSLKPVPAHAATLKELRGEIRKAAAGVRDKGIIVHGPGEDSRELDTVPFRGTWVGRLTVTYFEPAGGANKEP